MALAVLPGTGQFVTDDRGLVIPARMRRAGSGLAPFLGAHPFDDPNAGNVFADQRLLTHVEGRGMLLAHNPNTGVAFWPAYASGMDDMLMRALVAGYMANAGQTPVLITLLSTIVTKIQGMVGTWINTLSGRTSPVKRALDIMARANDSQFGPAEFVREYMGALSVDNRGAIGAQVPIGTIEVDRWPDYGMNIEVIPGQDARDPDLYVLRMEQESFRENQGIWMLDGLHCLPTGVAEWPYWIKKHSRQRERDIWVLVHRDFGFQILQHAGPKNTPYAGFGQSGTWRFSPYALKSFAIDRQDWEHLISQPMRGIVWVSGLDTPTQFREQLQNYQEERQEGNMFFYPGVFFGGSRGENSKISMLPWSEPPAGYTPAEWRDEVVSKLAASFHMNETHLQLKLGEGAMTQSGVAESLEAETAVAWMRHMLEMVWNHVTPPRVLVQVIWQSDRQRRFQVETWREMSLAISRINKFNPSAPDEEAVLSREEIRGLITQYIGIEIPEVEEGGQITTDRHTGNEIDEVSQLFGPTAIPLSRLDLPEAIKYMTGNRVRYLGDGMRATITAWSGQGHWLWVRNRAGHEMLVPAERLALLEPHKLIMALRELRQQISGDPLPFPTEQDTDMETAVDAAKDLWDEIAPDEVKDLL